MKFWIDLANAPHVSFFLPIIRRLQAGGHELLVTLRDFNNTVAIAERHGLAGVVVGRHGGRRNAAKVLNLAVRTFQLLQVALSWKPEVCLSHNSYTQAIVGRLIGSRVLTLMDFEGQPANHLAFRLADKVIVPDCFPAAALKRFGARGRKIIRYRGFKEQLYLSDYSPDACFPAQLKEACGLAAEWDLDKNVLVTVRAPAVSAAYQRYHKQHNQLFEKLLRFLENRKDLTVVVLPRDGEQKRTVQKRFPNLKTAAQPLIGADLVWHSDVVLSAGGTMNREAAVLGTPAYTLFTGRLPAVDRRLIELGRMKEITEAGDFANIPFVKKGVPLPLVNPELYDQIFRIVLCAALPASVSGAGKQSRFSAGSVFKMFYLVKKLIPRKMQLDLRRALARYRRRTHCQHWPIDAACAEKPPCFQEWPNGKRFALVLRHDVESCRGLARVRSIAQLEKGLGLRSAFFFVAGSYQVPEELLEYLRQGGNEIGVHGWKHDGKLYWSRARFEDRAVKINRVLQRWRAVGFASPAAHHNFGWLSDLRIDYDCSSFDVDPFEPQPDGLGSIFPVRISNPRGAYIELPYTLPQDFTLYVILRERSEKIWKEKVDWLCGQGGMVLLNTHPDYMSFAGQKPGGEEYPAERYRHFLKYVLDKYEGKYWLALPREVASFWRSLDDGGAGNQRRREKAKEKSGAILG